MVVISRRLRARRRSRVGGRPHSGSHGLKSGYEAKFIEIENDKIINGVAEGTMNMNINYDDQNYLAELNKYKPSKKNGIHVGDILYVNGSERQYSCFVALPGNVQWLGDDGDTPDFILNLLKYKTILDSYNVRYNDLFRNQDYFVLRNGLEHIFTANITVSEHLLGSVVETTLPAEILNQLLSGGLSI